MIDVGEFWNAAEGLERMEIRKMNEAARQATRAYQALEGGGRPEEVARACGYANEEHMRESIRRHARRPDTRLDGTPKGAEIKEGQAMSRQEESARRRERAERLLEQGKTEEEVAKECGYKSARNLRISLARGKQGAKKGAAPAALSRLLRATRFEGERVVYEVTQANQVRVITAPDARDTYSAEELKAWAKELREVSGYVAGSAREAEGGGKEHEG